MTSSKTLPASLVASLLVIGGTSSVVADYKSTVLGDSPVGYWRLDELSGATATNLGSLGAGANGTYTNVTLGQPGALVGDADTAANFNGTSSALTVPFTNKLNTAVFSIECWVNPSTVVPANYMAPLNARVSGSHQGYTFYAPPNSTNAHWEFWTGNGSSWNYLSGPLLVSNQWAHLVGTYDGTNSSFYVNGALAASGPEVFVPNSSSALQVGVGGMPAAPAYYFSGGMDEVAVYSNALSPAQVLAHYAAATTETVSSSALTLVANPSGQATALTNRLTNTRWLPSSSALYSLSGDPGLAAALALQGLSNGEVQLTLTITNPTAAPLMASPAFPTLSGLTPGAGYGDLFYCFPQQGKVSNNDPGTMTRSYGGGFPLQFIDVYNASAGGIYLRTEDLSLAYRTYWITKSSGSVALGVNYASQTIQPGASWTLTAVVGAHAGDWHAALTAYQAWVKTWYAPLVPRKSWFQDVYNFRQIFLYPNSVIGDTPAYDPSTQTYSFASLLAQDRAAFGGVDYVHMFDWSQTPTGGVEGDYNPWTYLGGVAAFSNQVAMIQAAGSPVGLYFNGYLLDKKSVAAQTYGTNWQLLDSTGNPYSTEGTGAIYACPVVSTWTNYLTDACVGAISNSAANGVYIDEYGRGWNFPCYNPTHAHPLPSNQVQAEGAMMRQIRLALPAATALYSEERLVDVSSQYQDGSFTYSICYTSTNDNPSLVNLARFALPDFKTFEIIAADVPLGNNPAAVKAIFFNGEGIWLEGPLNNTWFPASVCQVIAKTHDILRTYADAFRGSSPVPLVPTLNPNLYANLFPGANRTVWTLYNAGSQSASGELLMVTNAANVQYYDAWNGQVLTPRLAGNSAYLTLTIAAGDVGCVVQEQNYRSVVLGDNPVGYWRLDESSGTTATNLGSLGVGANGTYTNVTLGQPGALVGDADTAASFNGTSSALSVPFTNKLNSATFSIECWVNPSTAAPANYMAPMNARVTGSHQGYTFYATPSPNAQWQFWTGNGSSWNYQSGPLLVANQWAHLVGTYDGTNQSFYVNGALAASGPEVYVPNSSSALQVGVGGMPTAPLYYFSGGLDEVAVYSNALSPAQVLAHYTAGLGAPIPPTITLQPVSSIVLAGSSVTLSVQAAGSLPLSYQWQFNGTNLPAATGTALVFGNVQPANAGLYQVIVSNPAGSITSSVVTITAIADTNSYSSVVLADGAVGYWRLNETNGTTAANLGSLGHAADGTYLNGVTLGLPGAVAGDPASLSAGFTASNGTTVDVPYAAQLNATQFTVEFWANMTGATGDYESPVTSRDNGFAGWMFYGVNGIWQLWTGTGSGFNELFGPGIQLGAWTYLAATYDGATVRFYVNGVQAAFSTALFLQDKRTVLRIGGGATESTPGAYFFQGDLDEVAVYTNALPLSSIQAHYAVGMASALPTLTLQRTATNLLIYWSGGTLQQTSQLPGAWSDVQTNSPLNLGATPPGTMFYRVRR